MSHVANDGGLALVPAEAPDEPPPLRLVGNPGEPAVLDRPAVIDLLDYSGHPCQAQLSRELARRGHRVRHMHSPDYRSGKGALERGADDPESFEVVPLSLGAEFQRYKAGARLSQEVRFGLLAARRIIAQRPDVAILSNVPLIADTILVQRLVAAGIPVVFWQQDVYSRAISVTAHQRLGLAGHLVSWVADRAECLIARSSATVVSIADAFLPTLDRWGVDAARTSVIPNWAPIDEMPRLPKHNDWAKAHDLADRTVFLYSGTLGLKHDPTNLLRIAQQLNAEAPDARMVVVSEGSGRSWLEEHAGPDLPQLVLLDFQPYSVLPQVLASGDVLVGLLEPDAGEFSVPSKTLNYLCAGRPSLTIMPEVNLAAQMISENDLGIVTAPGDLGALEAAVRRLSEAELDRRAMGDRARAFAERTFDIDRVVARFEECIASALMPHRAPLLSPGRMAVALSGARRRIAGPKRRGGLTSVDSPARRPDAPADDTPGQATVGH